MFNLGPIRSIRSSEPCAVCFGVHSTSYLFPAEGCTHAFCAACVRDLVMPPQTRERAMLNPVLCGGPPCPRGCMGAHCCECEEYVRVLDAWFERDPTAFDRWTASLAREPPAPHTCRGSRACPLCRRKCPELADPHQVIVRDIM